MSQNRSSKRLTISISQVAPLIGLDHYNNFPRIVCEIWRRYDPDGFRAFELKMKTHGVKQLANSNEMNDIWELDELYGTNILQQVKDINLNKGKTSGDMVKLQDAVIQELKKVESIPEAKKLETAQKICSITNKMHGIINEDSIINEFCRLSEKEIQQTQGWVEIPLPVANSGFVDWYIVGKYDAITTEGELVEAKMRQKGLFKRMRDYENVQVQLYLHILGFDQGFLVEGYKKEMKKTGETQLSIYLHEIAKDKPYIEEFILVRLRQFTSFFNRFINDEEMKEIIISNDPNRVIYDLYQAEYLDCDYSNPTEDIIDF